MPTKTTGKGLQRVTSRGPDKPRPREHAAKGARPCCTALEKRKRKLGMYVKIYSYESRFCLLTILMDSQVSKSLKQQFLILLLCRPALHVCLSLSLSLSLSLNSIQFNLSVLYWHDNNYTFVLPKQLQLGCSQIVHICINRRKNNNNCNNNNI